jgi:polyisoprenoid-binding protein YceI
MNVPATLIAFGLNCLFTAETVWAADFVIDQTRSTLEVAVHATADKFVAKLERFDGTIQVDKESGTPTGGKFTWNFNDLKTGKPARDKEMLHWLSFERFPEGSFTFQKCELKEGQALVTGELKMHDVAHPLTLPLKISRSGSDLIWEGRLTLDHREYDLPRIVKLAVLRVDPVLKIHFTLSGSVRE